MKALYLEIMDRAVQAYSEEKIEEYIHSVETEGIREHGFPRLTANIGILIAHGRQVQRKEQFFHMMDLCTSQIPVIKQKNGRAVGNDFSVREICFALLEVEKAGICSEEQSKRWREALSQIHPYEVYSDLAEIPPKRIGNWAQFAATSEVVRMYAGIGEEKAFMDAQMASQVLSFDENGFYRDPNEPMLYDLMTRLQMSMALYFGYDGLYAEIIHENLMKSSMPTLYMQSVTGELPFGGRSNQFLFNEAAIAAMCEYYAIEYQKLGQPDRASEFKRAAHFAAESIMQWLDREDVHHIKNCYPSESNYGCEDYAYFNKYMVTMGSNIYCGYIMADDTISEAEVCPCEIGGYTYQTGEYFHKVFLNSGKVFAEIDYRADYHYDASGLGRIHFAGAPSLLVANVPFTTRSTYHVDIENPYPFSLSGGLTCGDEIRMGSDPLSVYQIIEHGTENEQVYCDYECTLPTRELITQRISLDSEKAVLTVRGEGKVCQMLPVLDFDGCEKTVISASSNRITVKYHGFICIFETNGTMNCLNQLFANRNGHYQGWYAERENMVEVTVRVQKE